jgi:hypothetical protein
MFAAQPSEPAARQSAAHAPSARQIVIQPSSSRYIDQMDALSHTVYSYDSESRADEFASQLRHFPEGQFIALDMSAAQPRVVGYTASMRLDFDPSYPLLDPWAATTGYG